MKRILLILAFLIAPQSAWAAITVVQCHAKVIGTANTTSLTMGALPTVGNHIISGLTVYDPAGGDQVLTFEDNQGNTYSLDAFKKRSSNDEQGNIYSSKVATSSGSFTITITFSGSGSTTFIWTACEVSDLATASWFDKSGTVEGAAATTTTVTASGANSTANAFVMAILGGVVNADTPSGYTERYADVTVGTYMDTKVPTMSETSSATWNHDLSTINYAVIATYKSVPPASSGNRNLSLLGVGN